jgi:hypothetical protein
VVQELPRSPILRYVDGAMPDPALTPLQQRSAPRYWMAAQPVMMTRASVTRAPET